MATPKKRKGTKKRRGKIKFSQTARLVERNDATRVAKRANPNMTYAPTPMPRTNGAVFKVKIKRK